MKEFFEYEQSPRPAVAHTLEIDHLRKKLAEQSKRIEVLVCEKSSLSLEMQNSRSSRSIESIMGTEFREFAPRKVHRFIIQFDEKCQQVLLTLQKTPNARVLLFGYVCVALFLNMYMAARFLLP